MVKEGKRMKAPFPYFGGKSTIAHIVWEALGQPKHYIEPFFGSGSVLLNRPNFKQGEYIETVNDKDGFISNVWRALQHAPDEVAKYCDYPVNHADLSARKKIMIEKENYLIENLISDPEWYDAKIAGYWIWAASCWIGSRLTNTGIGVHGIGQRPHISNAGIGVHKIGKRPHLSNAGMGVHGIGQIPHVGDAGKGVHKVGKRPPISHEAIGVQEPYNTNIYKWFRELSERLRYVRVVCGEWNRVCGGDWQDSIGVVGMFFDPPYGVEDRDTSIYHHDSTSVAGDVLAWVRERGAKESYRIVTAGYEEYQSLLAEGWTAHNWEAGGGYSTPDNNNRHRETLYFSPHCQTVKKQGVLL